MKENWDKRYATKEFVYGKKPNAFFKDSLSKLDVKGKLLLPAEGEGRNAVYAATQEIQVRAFDISEQGKNKAKRLAKEAGVEIKYQVGDLNSIDYKKASFDAVALIFAHFPPIVRNIYHRKISELLKPGGLVILESFSKNNLELREKDPKVGGPNNLGLLYSPEEIMQDFKGFEIIQCEEVETNLQEGSLHVGTAKVVRFLARKTV